MNLINSKDKNRISRFKLSMMFGYTAVIVFLIVIVASLIQKKTDEVLKSKVTNMTSALTVQMKMNINSYLAKLETTGTLVFASEEVYTYSAVDDSIDEYDALSTEKIISDKLYSLCIMENFVDFGIVYSNNHVVGKVSNGTVDLFDDRLYEDLSAVINRQRTSDGWSTGYNGDFKRIYYVKRINEDAILVTSFYTTELEEVFEHPGGLDDITVRLADSSNAIIYSSKSDETGTMLPDEVVAKINDRTSATIMDDDYLITVNGCGDDWKVICSVPTQIILKEKNEVQYYIIIVALAASVLALLISAALSYKISNPVGNMLSSLSQKASIDQLTSLLNKRSFEELTENALKTAHESDRFCIMLFDIDNFKGVNDNFGHAVGDKVLSDVGRIMRRQFKNDGYLGRLGGDEFCVFIEIPEDISDMNAYITEKCSELCGAFENVYADEKNYKVSISIGAAASPDYGRNFSELYRKADKALYRSKKKGKDTFSLYGADDV